MYGETFSHDMLEPGFIETEYKYEDVILWIDPIDAKKTFQTSPFDITTMIGFSVKGRPKAGILNKPFFDQDKGRTMVGTVESGCFQYDTSIETQTHSKAVYLPPNKQQIEYPITLIESEDAVCTKYNTPLYQTFDNVRVVEKRGVGSIIFDLLEGKGDLHLNFVPDYKGWDVCGPAALLMSRLGYVADSRGQPLVFDGVRNQYAHWNGFVAARHVRSFKEIRAQWEEKNGTTFKEKQLKIRQQYHLDQQEARKANKATNATLESVQRA